MHIMLVHSARTVSRYITHPCEMFCCLSLFSAHTNLHSGERKINPLSLVTSTECTPGLLLLIKPVNLCFSHSQR